MAEDDSSSIEVLSQVIHNINCLDDVEKKSLENRFSEDYSVRNESDSSDDEESNNRYELSIEELLQKANTSSINENVQVQDDTFDDSLDVENESKHRRSTNTLGRSTQERGANEERDCSTSETYDTDDSESNEDVSGNNSDQTSPEKDSNLTDRVFAHHSPPSNQAQNRISAEENWSKDQIEAHRRSQQALFQSRPWPEKQKWSQIQRPILGTDLNRSGPPFNLQHSKHSSEQFDPNQCSSPQRQRSHPQNHIPKFDDKDNSRSNFKITPQLSSKLSQSSHNWTALFFLDGQDGPSTSSGARTSENFHGNWKWDDASFAKVPLSPHFCQWDILAIKLVTLRSQCETSELQRNPSQIGKSFGQTVSSYQRNTGKLSNFEILSRREISPHIVSTLPIIIHHALQLPLLLSKPIRILGKGHSRTILLTKKLCCSFLANAFLCTWPEPKDSMGDFNFFSLFHMAREEEKDSVKTEKIMCILNYFHQMNSVMAFQQSGNIPDKIEDSIVSFERRLRREKLNWSSSTKPLSEVQVDAEGKIEEKFGMLQVDFANKIVGGGVLNEGSVMEEIRFCICPELLVARLFTEELDDDEVLVVKGTQQFSKYDGYASAFQYRGPEKQFHFPKDEFGRMMTEIVAMDAIPWRSIKSSKQFKKEFVDRELHKALVGFEMTTENCNPVATGNWGCGAFNGDPELKFLIQWMAASECGRSLCFHTMTNVQQAERIRNLERFLKERGGINVGLLYKILLKFHAKHSHCDSVFDFVMKSINAKGNV